VQTNTGDDVSYVVLHAPRALLDTASLSLVARGFAALASGHKLPHHVPFGIYLSFATTKDASLSQQFWSTTLAGLPPLSLAPTVPSTQERSSVYVDLDVDTCEKLRRCPVDRKTLFETAWALTLQQHTGTQDVAFGVVGRDVSFAGADTCVGLLDHIYPLRAKFDADATFGDAASAVRQFHREASPHAHIGYSTIQNTLPNSTLESVLAFSPDIKHMLPGGIENTFSLSIFVTGTASVRVTACFDHASASGGTGRVEMLLLHLVQAVADAATKIDLPGTKCSAIDLGSAAERGVILSHAREGRKDVPQTTILQLLAQSIATNANKTAIELGTHKKATYAELNALAGRVARDCLQHLSTTAEAASSGRAETVGLGVGAGVGPGAAGSLPEIVPICIGRSVELIAAMLAVLQSGAAYALLDPEAPSARNQAIIEACGAKGVLVQSRMVGRFAGVASWNVDDALEDTPAPEQGPAFKAAVDVTPASLAYVVFTSGSTGKPKGVMVSHGAAAAGMQCHGVAGLDRWLLFYNPIFSAAQRTMLSTLVHGATLLIARKDKLTQDLPGVLRAMRVDALGITPSALAALPDSSLEGVKRVVMVGEAVSSRVVDRWASKVALFNTYGLSECAQLNFSRRLHPGDNARIVGAPADTTAAYVLRPGSEASLAPIGIAGELCLASDQLADGYLGQPEATQRAFQKNPFGKGRLFRTGDAARLLPNGDIEVTGRLDFQAKIAGQKVDPAEIDQVLRQHPSVARSATAAVALHEPASSDASLVAAVVLQTGLETGVRKTLASLREHVAARLPSYMVPAYWMPLDVIPSSANGKVDVRAVQKLARDVGTQALLKNVLADGDVEDCEDGALVDALEVAVAECWAAVLDLPLSIIKRQYDFVSLGGSSIHAIRVISMLQGLGYAAAMADLLTPGTSLVKVASLLAPLDAAADEEAPPFSLVDTSSRRLIDNLEDAEDAYPATPLQESLLASLVAEDQDTARMYIYHRVWKVAHLDIPRLRRAMEAAFAKSEILRTSFTPTASGYVQVVHSNWQLPWTETDADLETATASAKQSLAQDAASSSKPLIRVVLVGRRHLVVVTHHALFDFWSHRFFYHDAAAAYDGDDILARPKFSRFVKHLSQLQQNGSAQQTAVFWREYLRGTEYPTLSSSVIPSSDGSATITKREMFGLSARIAQAGFTPGPVLYSAWALLLWHRTRNVDAVFATALGGRDAPVRGIDRIDGPTLTTAPQRIVVQPEETLQDLVRRVSEQLYQVMKYSQFGMREATKAAGLDASVVDTLVNVLVRGDEPEQVWSVFRPSGPRSVWESDRITMEIDVDGSSGSGSSEIRLIGKIDARQAQFLLDSYADLVELIISSPSSAVSSLDIMTPAERCVVATELTNADSSVYPNPSLVHSAFVDIAKSCSGQSHLVAVDWRGESQQTYAQLNARANAVAHRLIQLGASVGDRIPLIMDKSEEMMSVILGVIKAGAAYVPLSPGNNAERNDFIVSDVRAKLVLAHRAYTDRVTASQVSVVAVEDIIAALPPTDENPHLPDLTPNHHAYVIYTSGSTGLPKGVQVPHRTAAAAVSSMVKAESRHIGEWRTLQFANYVFDASAQDFFNTLSTGGALCMAPTDEMQSNLAGLIKVMNVKQAILTPTVAKILHPEEVPSMKTLILGGEPMTKDVVDKWLPHCDILNVYGPTETSMVVTTKKVEKGGKTAAIGKPFDTVQAYLVDPDGEHLVPYGSVGELCVAGPQVTDGYVGREDLTAAAFTNNKALGSMSFISYLCCQRG
jgi:amino acid adenylation domain-containing protein